MSQGKLFREESVKHQQDKWAGKAMLLSSLPAKWVATFSILFILTLIAFLVFGSYTRRIQVSGEITTQPGAMNVFSAQQGIISKRYVKAGQWVKKGQPLYRIDLGRVTDSGKVSVMTRISIENQLTKNRSMINNLKKNKKATLDNVVAQREQYIKAHKLTEKLLENTLKDLENMRKSSQSYAEYQMRGLVTKEQSNNQQCMYSQQQSTYQTLFSQSMQESVQIATLGTDLVTRSAEFDNQIAQLEAQMHDLERQQSEAEASGMIIINAPDDGRVESLSVTQGQMVNIGDSLAQLLPGNKVTYYLILWVPNNSVPYIKKGDRLNLRYEAFPYEKFGQFQGEIANISYLPASVQEMSTYHSSPLKGGEKGSNAFYKVLVSIDSTAFKYKNKELHLSSGLKADATLFLEKRPLYQWMFAPFFRIQKSVAGVVNE